MTWFWHIKMGICVIGPLTSTAPLWGYRKWAAKYFSNGGKTSSRADQASATLHQLTPRGRWVLSRCHYLAGQQCCLLGCWNLCLLWELELCTNCFLLPMWISPVLSTASPDLHFWMCIMLFLVHFENLVPIIMEEFDTRYMQYYRQFSDEILSLSIT